jgi:hypothetical protein
MNDHALVESDFKALALRIGVISVMSALTVLVTYKIATQPIGDWSLGVRFRKIMRIEGEPNSSGGLAYQSQRASTGDRCPMLRPDYQ